MVRDRREWRRFTQPIVGRLLTADGRKKRKEEFDSYLTHLLLHWTAEFDILNKIVKPYEHVDSLTDNLDA